MERAVGQPRSTLRDLAEILEEEEGPQDARTDIINRLSTLNILKSTTSTTLEKEQPSQAMSSLEITEPVISGVPQPSTELSAIGVEPSAMEVEQPTLPSEPRSTELVSKNSGVN